MGRIISIHFLLIYPKNSFPANIAHTFNAVDKSIRITHSFLHLPGLTSLGSGRLIFLDIFSNT